MRKLGGWFLLAILVLWPGLALAEPTPIPLAEYQAKLETVVKYLESGKTASALDLTNSTWLVQTPAGPLQADLRPIALLVGKGATEKALALAREHLRAAEMTGHVLVRPADGSRQELARILAAQRTQRTWQEKLDEWLRRIFEGADGESGAIKFFSDRRTIWGALAVGLLGLGLVVYNMVRSLSGYGAATDVTAQGLRGARADRPMTPDEQWAEAQRLSQEGEHQEALRMGYLALLKHFDRLGLMRYVPAQTNHEHLSQVRRRHLGMARALGDLTALVEERLFSGQGASANDFAASAHLIEQLWREGDATSKSVEAATGASSSAPSP